MSRVEITTKKTADRVTQSQRKDRLMTLDPSKLGVYARDPALFRADLMVDAGGRVVRFGDVLNDWQRDDFAAMDGGWMRAVGLPADGGCSRAYLERPRGHSKSTDIAVMATWAILFSPRSIVGIAAAADADQGALLLDAIRRLLLANQLLSGVLDVQRSVVKNNRTGSELRIVSSDVGSSFGMLVDYVICDELTHWPPAGESLWDSLFSTIAKRSRCFCCVISNSGFQDSWQWRLRERPHRDRH